MNKFQNYRNKTTRSCLLTLIGATLAACSGSENQDISELKDTKAPVISIIGAATIHLDLGEEYIDSGATAVDETDKQIAITTQNNVNTNKAGTYTVTYLASDLAGNQASKVRSVVVSDIDVSEDQIAPIITLLGEQQVYLPVGSQYVEPGAMVTDNLDLNLSITITSELNTDLPGTYKIQYNSTDTSGNQAYAERTVVVEPLAPFINEVLLEAEDYSAYSDSDAGNQGNVYKTDDVDIEATSDTGGGYNVGWTVQGEWLEYDVAVSSATYSFTSRVASDVGGGTFTITINNKTLGPLTVNRTGGWQTFESKVVGNTILTEGTHRLRIDVLSGNFNLNWIKLNIIEDADSDGVANADDLCAETHLGQTVNIVGCPDSDNDTVFDDIDQCPDTPSGDYIDRFGCSTLRPTTEIAARNNMLIGGPDSEKPGFTLYTFDNDLVSATSTCYDECAQNWPPVIVTDGAASGLQNLSTITRADGTQQAAFNGQPLYFFIGDVEAGNTNGDGAGGVWHLVEVGKIGDFVSLFDESTSLAPVASFTREDGVIVTRVADRGRDRHAKDITEQDHYDHFLAHYWEYRTARIQLEDYTQLGQSLIKVTMITEAELGAREFRVWYNGSTTTGQFNFNPQKDEEKVNPNETGVVFVGRGSWNDDFEKISEEGHQFKYTLDIIDEWESGRPIGPITTGQRMEFEASQFLLAPPAGSRLNYYGTTFLYITGQPGVHPFEWERTNFDDSYPIPTKGLLGGATTLGYNYSEEPAGRFMGMATNMNAENAQPWVEGRRVHHTNFETGEHDERDENIIWTEQIGKAGNHYINNACSSCHIRNGRALVAKVGEPLSQWVFKIGDENGEPDPLLGRVLQPLIAEGAEGTSEGNVTLGNWTEHENGLRSPNYVFSNGKPVQFSARIAPQLVGLGLLEAIPEETILAFQDPDDNNNDGISGRASVVSDPVTGEQRLGRFGYKASTASVEHQVAAAFNTDMGVMTSILPSPDCGTEQQDCDDAGSELNDEQLNKLVKYISLLGVPARRDYDVTEGETLFSEIGCADCHRPNMTTSPYHPLAELRSQNISPYTDLLLHDMGEGLADNLAEGSASGVEWRTAPLWGLGHAADVMVRDDKANDSVSLGQSADDIHRIGFLHDGRARSIEEAILWHGGEAQTSKDNYTALSEQQKQDILDFLNSL